MWWMKRADSRAMHIRRARHATFALTAGTGLLLAWWVVGAFGSCGVTVPIWSHVQLGASSRGGAITLLAYSSSTPARLSASFHRWRGGCTGPGAHWSNWKINGAWPVGVSLRKTGPDLRCGIESAGWLPVLLCGLAATRLRVRGADALGHCAVCGYDLRGLASGACCPECGSSARTHATRLCRAGLPA